MNSENVSLSFNFLAPPEIVFDAWVNEDLIHKWLFVGPTSEIINVMIDLRVNGKFSILELEKSNNEHIDHYGEYLEISKPNKLAFTLSVPKHFPDKTNVVIKIMPEESGCKLTLIETGMSVNLTQESWKKMLEQLKLTLENQ
jgi:uncharacterized protein YndB with AHSA1/START domain